LPDKDAPVHELIPQHKLLSVKDAEEVLATFRVSRHQIPKIFAKDPALAGLGAKVGQIVEVTRLDDSKCYRLVV
jgi:DNA-directed RNA polymerase subunit H